jgi:isoleucyl-tRNA synthetase
MNGIELFERIKQVSTFDELLQSVNAKKKAETQSKRGNVFEKVCDIIINFGCCSILPNDIYDHYEGNIAECKLKKVIDLEMYVKKMKVLSKGKGGKSDMRTETTVNSSTYNLSESSYFLAWTTTPWTLLGNVALAVGEKIKYVVVDFPLVPVTPIILILFLWKPVPVGRQTKTTAPKSAQQK